LVSLPEKLIPEMASLLGRQLPATDEGLQPPLDLFIHMVSQFQRGGEGPSQRTQPFTASADQARKHGLRQEAVLPPFLLEYDVRQRHRRQILAAGVIYDANLVSLPDQGGNALQSDIPFSFRVIQLPVGIAFDEQHEMAPLLNCIARRSWPAEKKRGRQAL
jgi:hypothetical protein